jgi:hypothetical protein
VVSRSALGRSDNRETSSTVGRVSGAMTRGALLGLTVRSDRAQPTSDHAARALDGPTPPPSTGFFERSRIARLCRDLRQNEPAPQMALCASEHGKGRRSAKRERARPRERYEELDAQRDAVALFDHGGERREVAPVRFIAHDTRRLRAESQVRLAARGELRQDRSELRVRREAGGAEGSVSPCFLARECSLEKRSHVTIVGFRDGADAGHVELAPERLAAHHRRGGVGHACAQRRTERRDRAERPAQLPLGPALALQGGLELRFEPAARRLVEKLGAGQCRPRRFARGDGLSKLHELIRSVVTRARWVTIPERELREPTSFLEKHNLCPARQGCCASR